MGTPEWEYAFKVVEIFSFIFVIEYSLRVYCCVEDPRYERSLLGRLKFMASFWSIVDLIAIIPYLYFITMHSVDRLGYDNDTAAATFSIVKLLRLCGSSVIWKRLNCADAPFRTAATGYSRTDLWLLLYSPSSAPFYTTQSEIMLARLKMKRFSHLFHQQCFL